MARERRKEIRLDLCPKRRAVKEERFIQESPLWTERSAWRGGAWSLGGEHSNWLVVGKVMTQQMLPSTLSSLSTGGRGLDAEAWALEVGGPRKGPCCLCEIEEKECRNSVVRRCLGLTRGKAPLLERVQGEYGSNAGAAFLYCSGNKQTKQPKGELPLPSWAPEARWAAAIKRPRSRALVTAHIKPKEWAITAAAWPMSWHQSNVYHLRRAQGHHCMWDRVLKKASIVPGAWRLALYTVVRGIMAIMLMKG